MQEDRKLPKNKKFDEVHFPKLTLSFFGRANSKTLRLENITVVAGRLAKVPEILRFKVFLWNSISNVGAAALIYFQSVSYRRDWSNPHWITSTETPSTLDGTGYQKKVKNTIFDRFALSVLQWNTKCRPWLNCQTSASGKQPLAMV